MTATVRRWGLPAAWLVLMTIALAWGEFRPTVAAPSLALAGVLLGLGFAVTAVLLRNQEGQRDNAFLFALLSVLWLAGQIGERDLGVLSPLLLWTTCFVQPIAAAVLLRYPNDRLQQVERRFAVIVSSLLGTIQAALIFTSTSRTWDEDLGERWWPTLWEDHELNRMLWTVRWAVFGMGGATFLILLWRRWRRLGRLERRTLAPILVTAAATGVMVAARFVDELVPNEAAIVIADVRAYSAAAVSLAFVVSAIQMRLAYTAIGDLAAELAESVAIDRVRDALRGALADPGLDVWYWLPGDEMYVDSAGLRRTVEESSDRLVVFVQSASKAPLAVVLAHPSLRRHRGLIDAAIGVSRLAIENAQLQASLRAQLVAVREARTRLMHAGLEQRRQLERDLHDGAQQRLLALGMRLGALEGASDNPSLVDGVRRAREDLNQALTELRDLAHGLYPAVLSQAGLGAAVEAVVERLPIPVTVDVDVPRVAADVESAAYFVICEALTNAVKHAGSCVVALCTRIKDDQLVIDISDNGLGMAAQDPENQLRTIRDRVDAAGGQLTLETAAGVGTRLVVELPCA